MNAPTPASDGAAPPAAAWDTPDTEARVEEFLGQMTLEEKVGFVTGDLNYNYGFYSGPLERLGLPALQMADGPAGVRVNKGDVNGGVATALPAPIALAATWDPSLAHEYGTVIGSEARATDHNVSLGPAVDIARVPVGGRTFESYGEDPRLTSAIGVEYVKGVQSQGVQACGKHYAINNQEDDRASIDAVIDERTMRELYLPPFEVLVREGEVASLMAAFNRINGEFACDNHTLQTEILRDVFGFRGWIMSDYSANHSTAESANAGLDQEQPSEGFWGSKLLAAVQNGEVAEATIDEKVRRILRPLIGMGQLENPPVIAELPVDEHHATAQRIAEAAMVLLRNDGVLPLAGVRKVALIGTDVDTAGAQGGGSSLVRGTKYVSPLEGLQRALGEDVEIAVAYGSEPVTPGALLPGDAETVPEAFYRTPDGERGLLAEFWTNTNHEGDPFVSRADGVIEHNWGFHNFVGFNAGSPRYPQLPGEVNGQSSARWTGTITAPVTGVYEFAVTALGRFSFWLDDQLIASSDTTPPIGKTTESEPAEVVVIAAEDEPVSEPEPEPEAERPMPLGASGFGGSTGPTKQYEASVRLVAGRPYQIRFDYIADDPSQMWLLGARVRLGWTPPAGVVSPDVTAAAELAASSDVAVVVVRTYEAEAEDRPHLRLPAGQNALVSAVLAANPRTVVVLMTGAPVDLTAWGAEPAALVQAWFPGQSQGDALARVLTGATDAGGRLPLTLPKSLAETPAKDPYTYPGVDGHVEYREGVFVGYRGIDPDGEQPAYPFGHGLSYTTFGYEGLEVTPVDGDLVATVAVTVRNTGGRAGSDVVQVYVGELPTEVPTPARQLAGFAKVSLEPGASTRVQIGIPRRTVSYFDVDTHDWATPTGTVEVFVGASSADIRLNGSVVVG